MPKLLVERLVEWLSVPSSRDPEEVKLREAIRAVLAELGGRVLLADFKAQARRAEKAEAALRDMAFDQWGAPTCWPNQERVMEILRDTILAPPEPGRKVTA